MSSETPTSAPTASGVHSSARRTTGENGAAALLCDPARGTIILTRQFRMPAYLNGHTDGMLLEVPAGLLDGDDAATAMRRELEEETGHQAIGHPEPD